MENKSGIVSLSFGAPGNTIVNRLLARITTQLAFLYNFPIYTQQDIQIKYFSLSVDTTFTEEELGSPPPTLRIMRGAVRWAIAGGIKTLWLVTAKPHQSRAVRDLKLAIKESKENIVIRVCTEVEPFSNNFWFSSESTQWPTRSAWQWKIYNWPLERMPTQLYTWITS